MADNWIKLDDQRTPLFGWNFDQKGIRIGKDRNPNVRNIELTQEDIDKINNSEQPLIKVETRSLRDCFQWNVTDPDDYIRKMTNRSDHTIHLDTYMRGEVEFNNFGENDIVKIMANAGKQIDRFYDIGVINDEQYAQMNTAIENRTKDLVKQLYSCRAAIEERDICAKEFNQNNRRIYITSEEHDARMKQLYNRSPIKFDNILDMINTKRASMWRDWLPEDWRVQK